MKKQKDLNKLTVQELRKELEQLEKQKEKMSIKKEGVWQIGQNYVIRTVTMIDVGKLIQVTDNELILEDASWIADPGRWNDFLSNGKYDESEPFPDGTIIINRNSIIDAVIWKHGIIRDVKWTQLF